MSVLLPAGVLRTIRQHAEDPAEWFGPEDPQSWDVTPQGGRRHGYLVGSDLEPIKRLELGQGPVVLTGGRRYTVSQDDAGGWRLDEDANAGRQLTGRALFTRLGQGFDRGCGRDRFRCALLHRGRHVLHVSRRGAGAG